ncbi:alpha/beta hydrolase [Thalassoporum mexicanum]|uniref:alpha/beta hydrolase n=1 Tax=Thalassoporum mexicanum TaxID=3457544 RepID=UPI0018DE131C|nr:alpha/beta hydrolase [Pseudanabaena sp. PCC 7367]
MNQSNRSLSGLLRNCLFVMPLVAGLTMPSIAKAADKITFRFPPIEQSIQVDELREFADTGKQSSTLKTVLNQTDLDPDEIQEMLATELDLNEHGVSLRVAERLLNTYVMELVLKDVGRVFHPPRVDTATVQALRGAIVTSLADDNKISLIEFLEQYPTVLQIEGGEIDAIFNRIFDDIQDLEQPLTELFESWQE